MKHSFTIIFLLLAWAAATGTAHAQVSFSGDLRLRHESTQRDPGADTDRQRYRLRGGASWKPDERLELATRIASGSRDPSSANLNFGESVSLSDFRLDRLYASWAATPHTRIMAGKMKNPLYRPGETQLVWDSDFNPTGLAVSADRDRWFWRAGAFLAQRRSDDSDAHFYAGQAGMRLQPQASSTLTLGLGWLEFTKLSGHEPLYDRPRNNSLEGGAYREDFSIAELFGELEVPLYDRPLTAYAQWTVNTGSADDDVAWTFGLSYGDSGKPGGASYSWAWRETQADALVGVFTESGFAEGNTGSRGHLLKTEYGVTDWLSVSAKLYLSRIRAGGAETDSDRLQVDLVLSF